MEIKVLKKRLNHFLAMVGLMFFILILRLAYLQLFHHDKYEVLALYNHQRPIPIAAPRGEMVDRNGVRIIRNRPVYSVTLTKLGLKDAECNLVVKELSALLVGEKYFKGCTKHHIEKLIRRAVEKGGDNYEPVRVAVDVSPQVVTRIEERRYELPGVDIHIEPVRGYPYGDLLVHVAGYVQQINEKQLKAHRDEGYSFGDMYGQMGLENTFEKYLRGIKGGRLMVVDAMARPVRDLGIKEAVPGNNLELTIDARLQYATQKALENGISRAQKLNYREARKGAAVVLDVRTGEVLAMASYPTYDPSVFTSGPSTRQWEEMAKDNALLNRCLALYPPGSVFKMVVAAAAMESGKIDTKFVINDPGYFKYKKDWKPGGHGRVNVLRAIAVSCDTFFWTVGLMTGAEEIGRYASEFGLGCETGIDLVADGYETKGVVPGSKAKYEKWKPLLDSARKQIDQVEQKYKQQIEKADKSEAVSLIKRKEAELAPLRKQYGKIEWELKWREYDTLDMSIGQGDNQYTPLQLANYVAAIGNGGNLYKPFVVKRIVNPNGREVEHFDPQLIRKVDISNKTLKILKEGMHKVTLPPDGTASGVFYGARYSAGAKTGTAEVMGHDNHALFTAFAPYENTEIALAVVVDYGSKGSAVAGPIAREILDAYFEIKNKPPTYGLVPVEKMPVKPEDKRTL